MPDVVPVTNRTAIGPALPTPCGACPWRISNHGRRHPGGWYTQRNRERLWAGMRRGERMSCHPTDPANPVPDGWREVPVDTVTRECRGYQILVMREMSILERIIVFMGDHRINGAAAHKIYRKLRRRGLTTEGAVALVERKLFGGGPPEPIDLNQPVSTGHDSMPWPVRDSDIDEVFWSANW